MAAVQATVDQFNKGGAEISARFGEGFLPWGNMVTDLKEGDQIWVEVVDEQPQSPRKVDQDHRRISRKVYRQVLSR